MEISISLIRNAATPGGQEGRFLGLRDEPIAEGARAELVRRVEEARYPPAQIVFTSGMTRCLETAGCVYPNRPAIVLDELGPYDYGDFAWMTYDELIADKRFAPYARESKLIRAPGGQENPYAFLTRCEQAFRKIVREASLKGVDRVGVVTHLMVIQAILRRHCVPRSPYRDWSLRFGGCYLCTYCPETAILRVEKEI